MHFSGYACIYSSFEKKYIPQYLQYDTLDSSKFILLLNILVSGVVEYLEWLKL